MWPPCKHREKPVRSFVTPRVSKVSRASMLKKRVAGPLAWFVAFVCITSVSTAGQLWDFLGVTQIDDSRDHGKIQVTRRDRLFRAIQLRVSGDSIFLDRVVVHFPNGTSEEVSVG